MLLILLISLDIWRRSFQMTRYGNIVTKIVVEVNGTNEVKCIATSLQVKDRASLHGDI